MIHLIDTLGFNDTYRTDSDVLKDLVFWLNKSYEHQIRLSGIVYLHPIHESMYEGATTATCVFKRISQCNHFSMGQYLIYLLERNQGVTQEHEDLQTALRPLQPAVGSASDHNVEGEHKREYEDGI